MPRKKRPPEMPSKKPKPKDLEYCIRELDITQDTLWALLETINNSLSDIRECIDIAQDAMSENRDPQKWEYNKGEEINPYPGSIGSISPCPPPKEVAQVTHWMPLPKKKRGSKK